LLAQPEHQKDTLFEDFTFQKESPAEHCSWESHLSDFLLPRSPGEVGTTLVLQTDEAEDERDQPRRLASFHECIHDLEQPYYALVLRYYHVEWAPQAIRSCAAQD